MEEKPSLFLDHSSDAECAGECSFQLQVSRHLNDPVAALPLTRVVRTLISDQVYGCASLTP